MDQSSAQSPQQFGIKVASGDLGITQTVAARRRLIDSYKPNPAIRSIAIDIVRMQGVDPKNEFGEVVAVLDWVRDNFRFTIDPPGKETLVSVLGFRLFKAFLQIRGLRKWSPSQARSSTPLTGPSFN
jgi:hypothetical protein